MVHFEYFVTYEDLLAHLDQKTGFSPPRIIEGKKKFLSKFNNWFINFDDNQDDTVNWRCIFPDPKLNISYPYPIDEITVACSIVDSAANSSNAEQILQDFHLDSNLSKRQTITLSGGELLLLSFAKAKSLSKLTDTIYICTPTQWLHKSKYFLLDNLIHEYTHSGKQVNLLMLEGEEYCPVATEAASGNTATPPNTFERLPWTLQFKDLCITFEAQIFPKETPAKTIRYTPGIFDEELQSPTLIMGDNGVGKSVFVKMLSNILSPSSGKLAIRCLGQEGHARILMQDSLDQLFGETIEDHLNRVFKYDKERGKKSKETYARMLELLRTAIKADPALRKIKLTATNFEFIETILQVKFALIAERLESKPPLLILDEPDWCLSKKLTKIFIDIVVTVAHEAHIPILIITHLNNWYNGIIHSIIEFKKGENPEEVLITKHDLNATRI